MDDIGKGAWDDDLLRLFGVPRSALPVSTMISSAVTLVTTPERLARLLAPVDPAAVEFVPPLPEAKRSAIARLGFGTAQPSDDAIVQDLFATLQRTETDYILFLRQLSRVPVDATGLSVSIRRDSNRILWDRVRKLLKTSRAQRSS